jgi:hypothetical protein
MGMLRLICTLLFMALLAAPAAAQTNALNDYMGPREIGVGESMRADAHGAASTTLNPAGLALSNQLVFEGSFGYRPEDGASGVNVSACDSTVPVPACYYYRYFKASPEFGDESMSRRAHEFGISAARALSKTILVGVNSRYFDYNSELTGESDASGFAVDIGTIIQPIPMIRLGVAGYNLIAEDSPQYPMGVGAGISVRPTPKLGIGADGLWNLEGEATQKGRFGVGGEYFLQLSNPQHGYPLRFGGVFDRDLDSSYVTAGLGYVSRTMGIDVGARKQVSNGDEVMVQASLRLFGPTGRH